MDHELQEELMNTVHMFRIYRLNNVTPNTAVDFVSWMRSIDDAEKEFDDEGNRVYDNATGDYEAMIEYVESAKDEQLSDWMWLKRFSLLDSEVTSYNYNNPYSPKNSDYPTT